jgi:hypothetical protein
MPKGYFFVEVGRPMRLTARAFRISSQLMEAKFSRAAKTRNRWMASSRSAAGLLSSSIAPRP